jgi:hypothetical protein
MRILDLKSVARADPFGIRFVEALARHPAADVGFSPSLEFANKSDVRRRINSWLPKCSRLMLKLARLFWKA